MDERNQRIRKILLNLLDECGYTVNKAELVERNSHLVGATTYNSPLILGVSVDTNFALDRAIASINKEIVQETPAKP